MEFHCYQSRNFTLQLYPLFMFFATTNKGSIDVESAFYNVSCKTPKNLSQIQNR